MPKVVSSEWPLDEFGSEAVKGGMIEMPEARVADGGGVKVDGPGFSRGEGQR